MDVYDRQIAEQQLYLLERTAIALEKIAEAATEPKLQVLSSADNKTRGDMGWIPICVALFVTAFTLWLLI